MLHFIDVNEAASPYTAGISLLSCHDTLLIYWSLGATDGAHSEWDRLVKDEAAL